MKTTNIANWLGMAGVLFAVVGCSQEQAVCSLVCDCEHCNDPEEDYVCESYETYSDVADAYDCADQWSELLTCVEDQGTCTEADADFSIAKPGTCGPLQTQAGMPCTTATDCYMPEAVCQAGECAWRSCVGSGGMCTDNTDCAGSETFCDAEGESLNACIEGASGRSANIGSMLWSLGLGSVISQPEY